MGHLAFVGSHRVNGVSALHTELMRTRPCSATCTALSRTASSTRPMASRFAAGCIRPIRGLTRLLCEACGAAVLDDPDGIGRLADHADDAALQERLAAVKRANKVALARVDRRAPRAAASTRARCSMCRSSASMNISASCSTYWTRSRYTRRSAPTRTRDWVPRVKIFAGKAAASYAQAKLIIKLANDVANVDQQRPGGRAIC